MNDLDYCIVAKFGRTFGINGWIKLISFTDPTQAIMHYSPLWLNSQSSLLGEWHIVNLEAIKPHGNGQFITKIKNLTTPEEAKIYTNQQLSVQRQQLAKLNSDEYYWTDLEGLTVINKKDITLGKIDYLIEGRSSDVMVIKADSELQKKYSPNKHRLEYLIPYLDSILIKIDLKEKHMIVDWDEDFF